MEGGAGLLFLYPLFFPLSSQLTSLSLLPSFLLLLYPLLLSSASFSPPSLQQRSAPSRNEINLLYYYTPPSLSPSSSSSSSSSLPSLLLLLLPHLNLILSLLCGEDWTRHFNLFILDMNLLACMPLSL